MKKIFSLSITALMIIGLVIGGTWAYFSDAETSTDNIFTAGILDLKLKDGLGDFVDGGVTGSFGGDDLAPGDIKDGTVTLKNAGNVDGASVDIKFEVDYTNEDDYDYLGIDKTDIDAATWLEITKLTYGAVDLLDKDSGAFVNLDIKAADVAGNNDGKITMDELNGVIIKGLAGIDKGDEKDFYIEVSIPTATGNGIQGDVVDVTVTFGLFQNSGQHLDD
ncbi:MAG: TasA family protein [Dehalococcoidales bacterium]